MEWMLLFGWWGGKGRGGLMEWMLLFGWGRRAVNGVGVAIWVGVGKGGGLLMGWMSLFGGRGGGGVVNGGEDVNGGKGLLMGVRM